MKIFRFITIGLYALLLTGCNNGLSIFSPEQQFYSSKTNEIEGTWKDASGILSKFKNGTFETKTTDTNEKLAEGTYYIDSNQVVQLNLRSLVRGTVSKVQCNLVSFNKTLTCTPENGKSFSLRKIN
ncbi:hypothetical protein [Bartonella sp. DGB1]|uniref:hypothetical protein n=1 Tax=Bartonella sp. DGB1 TaxID=3239807 RepID=UPI0035242AB1